MPKLSAGVVLALIICSLPALAQQGSVVLSVGTLANAYQDAVWAQLPFDR